jgi:protein disulfide-isomerase
MVSMRLSAGLAMLLVVGGALQGFAEGGWITDFEAAKAAAAKRKVPIIANFSGSDWCGWCIKLDREVFAKADFLAYAKDHAVLLHLDFPSRKKQSEAIRNQNKALAAKYGIRGYPTIIILDSAGKELGRTGYKKGGPKGYIKHLQKWIPEKQAPVVK